MREVLLTDEQGNTTGLSEIMEAHTGEGKLHKAFSIYIFRNRDKEILIQKRSDEKMLFPLIWANTCCSHPFPDEDIANAANRRLKEECGLACELHESGTLVYKAEDPNGNGVEHEHVTLLKGELDEDPNPNPDEISEMKWMKVKDVIADMKKNPDIYAPWFHLGLKQLGLVRK